MHSLSPQESPASRGHVFTRATHAYRSALVRMRVPPAARAIVDYLEGWFAGPSLARLETGVAVTVRRLGELLGLHRTTVERALKWLLSAGLVARLPDPDTWHGYRYWLVHPSAWPVSLGEWEGPAPIEVEGLDVSVYAVPSGWGRGGQPMDKCPSGRGHTRARVTEGILKERSFTANRNTDRSGSAVDAWWCRVRGQQVSLVLLAGDVLRQLFGDSWREVVPTDPARVDSRLVALVAQHVARLDDRAGSWAPPLPVVRLVIARASESTQAEDDRAAAAALEAEQRERERVATAAWIIERWGELRSWRLDDETRSMLGAAVERLERGNLAELELAFTLLQVAEEDGIPPEVESGALAEQRALEVARECSEVADHARRRPAPASRGGRGGAVVALGPFWAREAWRAWADRLDALAAALRAAVGDASVPLTELQACTERALDELASVPLPLLAAVADASPRSGAG